MKKLIAYVLIFTLLTAAIFAGWSQTHRVAAAEFTPPVETTDPNCKLSTAKALESWRVLYPESTYLTTVRGENAARAVKLYNELPPRSGVVADTLYVFSHPKVKGVQAFADNAGCLSANVFLPDYYYKMLIGKAK